MSLQSTDPIADLLTRIRNAALVGKTEVRVPTSKLNWSRITTWPMSSLRTASRAVRSSSPSITMARTQLLPS